MTSTSTNARKVTRYTLVLPIDVKNERIFLAKKARGFGIGKWIGFGGKIEKGESISDAAVRELREETAITVSTTELLHIGITYATFDGLEYDLEIYIFIMTTPNNFEKHVSLNDEFTAPGQWFHRDHIPFHLMWCDFKLWCSKCFDRVQFRAQVHYTDEDSITSYSVDEFAN